MTVNKLILILLIVWFGLLILYNGFYVESLIAMRPYDVPDNYSGLYSANPDPVPSKALMNK
jgi:hypothetical protein